MAGELPIGLGDPVEDVAADPELGTGGGFPDGAPVRGPLAGELPVVVGLRDVVEEVGAGCGLGGGGGFPDGATPV